MCNATVQAFHAQKCVHVLCSCQEDPINLTVVNNSRIDSSHLNVYAGQLALIYLLQSQFSLI